MINAPTCGRDRLWELWIICTRQMGDVSQNHCVEDVGREARFVLSSNPCLTTCELCDPEEVTDLLCSIKSVTYFLETHVCLSGRSESLPTCTIFPWRSQSVIVTFSYFTQPLSGPRPFFPPGSPSLSVFLVV